MTTVMEEQISSIIDDFIDVKDPIKSVTPFNFHNKTFSFLSFFVII